MKNSSTSDVFLPPEDDDSLGMTFLKGIGIFIGLSFISFIIFLATNYLGTWSAVFAAVVITGLVGNLFSDNLDVVHLLLWIFVATPIILLLLSIPDL